MRTAKIANMVGPGKIHFFACDDGWHLTLGRLDLYHFHHGVSRYWRPWRSDVDGSLYFLRFCVEWIRRR